MIELPKSFLEPILLPFLLVIRYLESSFERENFIWLTLADYSSSLQSRQQELKAARNIHNQEQGKTECMLAFI